MFVTQRSHVVQQAIQQAADDMHLMNPVSLVENHSACRKNQNGQRVLPNGQVWKPHLLLLSFASKILVEANMLLNLQASPPGKPFAARSRTPPLPYILSTLLQSRPQLRIKKNPGYKTVGSKDLTCEDWMVNTRTDADLSAAVQNALQALLPQIHAEIREEFRTSSGPSDASGNLLPVTIHTWLERFNKQKPHSFEKATAPVDAKNWISHMEKIFNVMGCEDAFKIRLVVYKFEGNALAWWKAYKQAKGGDAWLITVTWADFKKLFFLQFFPRAEQERLKREYHSIRQTNTETSTEFMQRFLRLAGFLRAAAGTEEEQSKNFQWGLRMSTLNHLMCMSYTDVAQGERLKKDKGQSRAP
nr:zinc finger, CCHC-type, retrotransposon Gag domain protein [Tanacetum cinerariifolium]